MTLKANVFSLKLVKLILVYALNAHKVMSIITLLVNALLKSRKLVKLILAYVLNVLKATHIIKQLVNVRLQSRKILVLTDLFTTRHQNYVINAKLVRYMIRI